MLYLKLFFIFIWLILSCSAGLLMSVFRWKDRNLDRDFARIFSWGALRISGIRVQFEGLEHLTGQPCVYVANHQSGMDMAVFGGIYPGNTVVIGKKELIYIPFFGLFFVAAGNIMINRQKTVKAIAGLGEVVEEIRKTGVSIWIFPEGTRNRSDEPLLPFKKGAFHMAKNAGVPIVPLVASPLGPLISWKEKKMLSGLVKVRVLPPVTVGADTPVDELTIRIRDQMIEAIRGLGSSSMN